jgi:ABC-type hemin transport system ATPase subunit
MKELKGGGYHAPIHQMDTNEVSRLGIRATHEKSRYTEIPEKLGQIHDLAFFRWGDYMDDDLKEILGDVASILLDISCLLLDEDVSVIELSHIEKTLKLARNSVKTVIRIDMTQSISEFENGS